VIMEKTGKTRDLDAKGKHLGPGLVEKAEKTLGGSQGGTGRRWGIGEGHGGNELSVLGGAKKEEGGSLTLTGRENLVLNRRKEAECRKRSLIWPAGS